MSIDVMNYEKLKMRNLQNSSHTHSISRGTGTPKDKDEVNKCKSCECDG
jgi:hypothetical protein